MSAVYYALKMAAWLSDEKYWQGGLSDRAVFNLIERALNHPEVDARWGEGTRYGAPLNEVDIHITDRGSTAWATRVGKPTIHLPRSACSPLVVLHEFAHLLPPTRREPDHGRGFVAINLMLVELLAPKHYGALLAATSAMGVRFDPSRIPAPIKGRETGWVPLSDTFEVWVKGLRDASHSAARSTRKSRPAMVVDPKFAEPPRLPREIRIDTAHILACNTDTDFKKLVLNGLRSEVVPTPMTRPKKRA